MKLLAASLFLLAALGQLQAVEAVQASNPYLAGPAPYSKANPLARTKPASAGNGKISTAKAAADSNTVPGLYIVEFEDNAKLDIQKRGLHLHNQFHAYMARAESSAAASTTSDKTSKGKGKSASKGKSKGVKYETRYTYTDPNIFRGLSVKLDNVEDVAHLAAAPGVKAVHQVRRFSVPAFAPTVVDGELASAIGAGSASDAVKRDCDDDDEQLARRASSVSKKDTFEPHVMTGVDKLHAQGYFGKGITVGVVDTGIDYTHPALNSGKPAGTACFGAGCQISGGYDFVGDNYTGSNTPQPDSNPFANCQGSGHGTHVTGTIIAKDAGRGFTGVVPEANVKMYRVFGCGEEASVTDDVIIQAMTYAYFDGVDIISLSIGGPANWIESPAAATASRISYKGIPVYVANGNEGSEGAFYGSSPATGKAVTAVGSVDNRQLVGYSAETVGASGEQKQIVTLTGQPWTFGKGDPTTLPVVPVTTDPSVMDDACKALPLTTDYTGKVVVVGRGTCTFVTKFQNIADRGGEYVLVYNTPYPASITYVAASIDGQQVASLTRDDGLYLKAQYAAGNPIKLDFSHQHPVTTADTNTGGTMSSFSTVTPTWENDIYPGISAPGGNILSTWPIALGEYAIISGTSMATPFVAGSSAMYKSIKGKKSASATQLRTIFSSTANPVELVNSTFHDTVVKQGGGLIDVNRAVFHTTTVSPGSIALNDTRHFKKGPQQITITNSGTKKQTYEVSHLPAATLNTMDPSTGFFELFPVPVVKNAAHIEFSTTKFSLSPGSSKMFSATFKPPKGLNKNDIPIYSGYIQINSTSSPEYGTVQVPYMGVYEDMYTEAVLDTSSEEIGEPLPVLADAEGNIIHDDAHIFTFTNDSSGKLDAPALYWRMRLGSALESVDLISADTKFKPTVPINDGSSSAPATRRQLRSDALTKVSRKHADLHTPSAHESHYARTVAAASDGSRKYSTIKTVGNILRQAWAPRDAVSGISSVQLEPTVSTDNATSTLTIPDGKYKLLLRVRKLFGDADKEADYESYLSHTFEIQTTPASQN